jgi:hypothetical protein
LDIEYADDVDFMDEEEENLKIILPMVTDILKRWNLFVDEVKADFTHVYLASTGEQDMSGKLQLVARNGGRVSLWVPCHAVKLTSSVGLVWVMLLLASIRKPGPIRSLGRSD